MIWQIHIYGAMDIHLQADYLPAAHLVAEALSEKWDCIAYITQGDATVQVYKSGERGAL